MTQREIKFRAWDNHNHRMFQIGQQLPKYQGWEIMQFTGLKDKNGKEIYEGDIVKYQDRISEIKFGRNDKWKECNGFYLDDDFVDIWGMAWHWEIIGNIYENKELLK